MSMGVGAQTPGRRLRDLQWSGFIRVAIASDVLWA